MRESVGFLFNRIWAAIKRECLMVVAEGVSTPEEVDRIWRLSLGTALGPFRMMDRIGLDVALAVEEHYATICDGIPAAPRELLRDYVDKGSSASSPAGASPTTMATDRGRPKRSHGPGVHAASRREQRCCNPRLDSEYPAGLGFTGSGEDGNRIERQSLAHLRRDVSRGK